MTTLRMTAAKNRQTGLLLRARRKVAALKAICKDSEEQEPSRVATSTARVEEAWLTYKEGQQDVLAIAAEDQDDDELAIFGKFKEICENALDKARETRIGMEQKAQEVDRIANPKDEVRTMLQALHSRIDIMAKQVEELEKEEKELQVQPKAQERKQGHIERAKRLEELPLLKLQHDESKKEVEEMESTGEDPARPAAALASEQNLDIIDPDRLNIETADLKTEITKAYHQSKENLLQESS